MMERDRDDDVMEFLNPYNPYENGFYYGQKVRTIVRNFDCI